MSTARGNIGYGGRIGSSQTSGDVQGNARGWIAAAAPGGGGPPFRFDDPVNSQNVAALG